MATKKAMSFEDAMTELQSVAQRLEAGKVPLEESLKLYERGVELISVCNKLLDGAEQRISLIQSDSAGITAKPFDGEGKE